MDHPGRGALNGGADSPRLLAVAIAKNRARAVVWSGDDPESGTVTVEYESGPPNISPGSEEDARIQVRRHFNDDYTETGSAGHLRWDRGR